MLCLSRKVNEGVVVSGPCRVIVVRFKGDKVVLGFEADPSVAIDRDEVDAAKLAQQECAE